MPLREMGEVAVEALDRVLNGEPPSDVVVDIPPVLVERASLARR
jgi:DNA-binding LacI/PurR family transcriptional regulator